MMTYREMADRVLRRAEEERRTVRRRRRIALLAGIPALCVVLTLAVLLRPKAVKTKNPREDEAAVTQPAASVPDPKLEAPLATEKQPEPFGPAQPDTEHPGETQTGPAADPVPAAELSLAAYLSNLQLPAADIGNPVFVSQWEEPRMTRKDLTAIINSNTTVEGTITGLETVRTEDRGTVWYLASMKLAVRDVLTGTAPAEIRVVFAAVYEGGAAPDTVPIPQLIGCREGMDAVFVLRSVKGMSWEISGKKVNPSEFGDYTAVMRLERNGNELVYPGQGLSVRYVPAAELPAPGEDAMEMIAFVVWKGGIYTESVCFVGPEADALQGLLKTRLGRASGSIDEWSAREDDMEELASTLSGDVYTVEGYSPDFRLCVTDQTLDAHGDPARRIQLLERLNGIAISTGADLYADRLCLDGRITAARYQKYEDWVEGRGNCAPLELGDELDRFLAALNAGSFRNGYEEELDFSRSSRAQAMLHLDLDDGTTVTLRLIEGGWVGYDPMPWYFIHLPAEAFDPIFFAVLP